MSPAATLARVREHGVLLSLAGGNVLRFTPPLCVTPSEIDEGVAVVRRCSSKRRAKDEAS